MSDVEMVDNKAKLPDNVFDSLRMAPGNIPERAVKEAQFMAGLGLKVNHMYHSEAHHKAQKKVREIQKSLEKLKDSTIKSDKEVVVKLNKELEGLGKRSFSYRTVQRLFWPKFIYIEGVSELLKTRDDGSIIFRTVGCGPKGCLINYVNESGKKSQCTVDEFVKFIGSEDNAVGVAIPEKIVGMSALEVAISAQATMENERLRKLYAEGKLVIFEGIDNIEAMT